MLYSLYGAHRHVVVDLCLLLDVVSWRSVDLHFSEACVNFLDNVVEVLLHLVVWSERVLELHGGQLVHHVVFEGLLDIAHRDLALSLGGVSDDPHAAVKELADGSHHTGGLHKRAVVVMLGERVLLQELILDDLGSL